MSRVPCHRIQEWVTRIPSQAVRRFLLDDAGQDLIEYGLLTGIITAGLIAVLPVIEGKIATAYANWGTNTNSLWVPSDPTP